jgi:hypothetical protein
LRFWYDICTKIAILIVCGILDKDLTLLLSLRRVMLGLVMYRIPQSQTTATKINNFVFRFKNMMVGAGSCMKSVLGKLPAIYSAIRAILERIFLLLDS